MNVQRPSSPQKIRPKQEKTSIAPSARRAHVSNSRKPILKIRSGNHFPIVGIGASAGGLEAFTHFLRALPVKTGMAFVLIQHLDPDHESGLAQILARTTAMQVCEVRDRMKVLPNRIYVIPPNVCMEIVKGVLKLHPREKRPGAARSIDIFFESLAEDQQHRAIGVVLSGTAMDGTSGLEMIKAEGGVTFAQDESAKYQSMPRSAIAAGCVDFVLSPEEIAKELARIAEHPWISATAAEPARKSSKRNSIEVMTATGTPRATGESAYKNILLLLQNFRGVDFSLYKSNTIERRINRRMVLNKQEKLADYAAFLQGNPKELDLLYSDLLINVTSFFRNATAFEALKTKVFPKLLRVQSENEPLRVWTLGCSTGQEAYTIAMGYTEACDNSSRAPKLQIFATDLNETHLEQARSGLYARNLVADISPSRLKRFFVEEQGGFRVSKSLRELCVFARHNILRDPPFSRMNLITCRNLLIYLEPESQKRIFPNLHYALKPGGFLMLGASESVGGFTSLFETADTREKIFAKKPGTLPAFRFALTKTHRADKKDGAVSKQAAPAEPFRTELSAQREADRYMATHLAPPNVLINDTMQILQFRGSTKAFLEPPSGKASFDLLKMAAAGLMLPLRAAINEARKKNQPARRKHVALQEGEKSNRITIEVVPLKNLKERHFLILFHAEDSRKKQLHPRDEPAEMPLRAPGKGDIRRIGNLEQELAEARDYAQSLQEQHEVSNEEVQAASEELQSANEELQSINEELETSKEELESTNEELTTVNEELASRNTEVNRVNSDLNNLQTSTRLPIVLLARDLRIRHFTPEAEKQFNLVAGDVGRPFGKVRHDLDLPDVEKFITDVIERVREQECEVRDRRGAWHLLYVRPYISSDNKVDGAVLVLVDIDARKRSEQAVVAALDFSEAILRTARDPFLILDASLRIERANEAFYSTFQVDAREVIGRTVFELDHGHWNVPKLRELLEDILPRHSFFNSFEVTTKFETIGYRTMLLNARTLNDTRGHQARILLGIQDITELLHFQAQMRQSELRYRRLFEAARDGVLVINPETRKIVDANPFMVELLGYPHQELIGKELFEIGLLKDELASQVAFKELHRSGFIRYEDLPLKTKTGARREVEFVSNLYDEGGSKIIQCNIRDITQRKLAERKFRGLLEAAPDAMIITTCDGTIELINAQTERMFGYTRAELIGQQIEVLIPQTFLQGHPSHRAGYLPDPQSRPMGVGLNLVGLRKDGSEFPIEISLSPVESESGTLMTAAVRDITRRKIAEEALNLAQSQLADRAQHLELAVTARTAELSATNNQLEAFVYSIAHDLRAPLRAIQGFATMLREESEGTLNEAGQQHSARISKSAQHMDALLQDLLAFSRISQQRVELARVNLSDVVTAVLSRLEDRIQEIGASVESIGPWPPVQAHEPTFPQVFFNLVSNALKFISPKRPPIIRLRTEMRGDFVRGWVEDNGIGIEEAHQPEIFRLFARLNGEKYPGTGLGLAIVQKGLERMGGRVGLESTPGEGTRFWFELKAA